MEYSKKLSEVLSAVGFSESDIEIVAKDLCRLVQAKAIEIILDDLDEVQVARIEHLQVGKNDNEKILILGQELNAGGQKNISDEQMALAAEEVFSAYFANLLQSVETETQKKIVAILETN